MDWFKIALPIFFLCFCFFYKNGNTDNIISLEISYPKGFLETNIPLNCDDISRMNISLKVDTLLTESKVLLEIEDQMKKLKELKQDNLQSICDIRMECNVKYANGSIVRLCLGRRNCILKNNIRMEVNDTLIYLIRKYSGYYCYFTKGDLIYFDEIKQFGVPNEYKDLSLKSDSNGIPIPPPIPK
jgi:hypothetical protein